LSDIKKFKPCNSGIERYLKVFKSEEVISWDEFVTRYKEIEDVFWLYNKFRENRLN